MDNPTALSNSEWWNQPLAAGVIPVLLGAVLAAVPKTRKWLVRSIKKFWYRNFSSGLNIALAIKSEEGLNSGKYYDEIKRGLFEAIGQVGLTKEIHVKDLSDALLFPSQEEAEKYGRDNKVDLIISGSFTADGLKRQGAEISELKLRFTFTHPDDNRRRISRMLLLDVNSKMVQKNFWKILESSSFDDVPGVTKNLFDISLYILALTLKVQGRLRQSVMVFEKLYRNLVQSGDPFQSNLVPHLINCHELLAAEDYFASRFSSSKDYSEKILALAPRNITALSLVAICQQKLGNTIAAAAAVDRLKYLYPTAPIANIDLAFFRIMERKYSDAYHLYKKLIKISASRLDYNPVEVVDFLGENFELSYEPALRYGSAVTLLHHLGDVSLAKRDFEEFLRLAGNKPQYRKMTEYATKMLASLN